MNVRPTQNSTYALVRSGMGLNFGKMVRSQEQLATGRSILRPSDDPSGTARVLALRGQVSSVDRWVRATNLVKPQIDSSAAALSEGTEAIARARELVIQAMNGTLSDTDRASIAEEIDLIRDQLLSVANSRLSGRYLFSGTATDGPAFADVTQSGRTTAVYQGDSGVHTVVVGDGIDVQANMSGDKIFAKGSYSGTAYTGATGLASGSTADIGTGYAYLELRHDSTSGALGPGLAFAAGNGDTILGDHQVVVDGAAGTVRLDGGSPIAIPDPASPGAADVVVTNEDGAELHLDFTGFTGADFSGTVTGDGSISINGVNFTPIDFAETDLELVDTESDQHVHVDLTGVTRTGVELVTFSGTVNVFDTLQGISEDLRNGDEIDASAVVERLGERLVELDRNHDNVIEAVSLFGMRSARLEDTDNRLRGLDVQLRSLLSSIEDADIASVVLDLSKAEQALELTQMSGARLIQTSLLNFLG